MKSPRTPLYALFLSSSLLLVFVATVQASESSPRPAWVRNEAIREAQEDFRETRKNAIDDRKSTKDAAVFQDTLEDAREDRKASISGARQTYRSERAKLHGQRLERRFGFYEQRLNAIALRIQTRIDKQKAAGGNVSKAQTSLDSATSTLSTAVADGKKAVELFGAISISTWDTQNPEVKTAIDQAMKARQGFVEARRLMMQAVQALAANEL